ncbi:DUF4251 domain-containing protein [Reichenbachiella versicolor]|uniref:DUF4251 domain-containing protein n=1 Tax=Reichenbachiella versicolor TaxID=1821036 RepID=UPI000D6DDC48|nr:DUF4251 domain-containing protein [Reichenbachiella versicolor]
MRLLSFIALVPFLLSSNFQKDSGKKAAKQEKKLRAYEASVDMADKAEFEFIANFANPMSGNNIPLTGPTYDLIVKGDSVKVFLPYFGVSRIAPDYGSSDRGIKYEGLLRNYSVGNNPKRKQVVITFQSDSKNQEVYRYTLFMGAGDDASLTISSTHRDPISFTGVRSVIELDDEKK